MPLNKVKVESVESDIAYDDLPITVFQPTDSTVQIPLSYPWGVRGIYGVLDTGTCDVQVAIAGTSVSFVTDGTTVGLTSSVKELDKDTNYMASAGDILTVTFSNFTGSPDQITLVVYGQRLP